MPIIATITLALLLGAPAEQPRPGDRAPAAAELPTPPAELPAPPAELIVTGRRLADAHAACVRGECTPLRDARVSIALAEEQFRGGAYLDAKHLLAAAVARNRRHAATDPKPVAALYEAYATVARHDGDLRIFRTAVRGQVETLRENLPPDDPAVLESETALGDMWITVGEYGQADKVFAAIERRQADAGNDRAAMKASINRIWLAAARGQDDRATAMLAALEVRPAAADPTIRPALRVLRLRLVARGTDDGQVDRLIADLAREPMTRPALISGPPYAPTAGAAAENAARRFSDVNMSASLSSEVGRINWTDIGFWIDPDGRTRDAEILRGSPSRGWIPPVLTQIAGRRYTTFVGTPAYRVERFTLRAKYGTPKDSNIRRRTGATWLESLDLTDPTTAGAAPPPPPAP
ncbi:hypothetical protein ACFSGX_14535 [Sphingomonas arantia]|uniref:Tetratricopeptide repeat protein n=1 Tax=Sphingomonas arantia TaxID=1460676 RepID=A0ABW4U1Y9_9SPHN